MTRTPFVVELDRALKARGTTVARLASALDMDRTAIARLRSGKATPMLETAAALAELLGAPALSRLAVEARTHTCATCGSSFVDAGRNGLRKHCGDKCRSAAHARRQRPRTAERTQSGLRLATKRLTMFRDAVAAHCRDCEPEGICRDAGCHLREVSPLAFVPINRRRAA